LHQDGLRGGLHRSARETLEQAEDYHLVQRAGGAAGGGGGDETGDRKQEIALAAEAGRDPSGHRDHDAVGDQIAGDDPGDFVDAGGKAAAHVREGDVNDRGVEDFENRPEHHRDDDDPFMDRNGGSGDLRGFEGGGGRGLRVKLGTGTHEN